MPAYFLHLRSGADVLLDREGLEIADPAQLREVAVREARALIAQEVLDGLVDLAQAIEVEDEAGRTVLRLPFAEAVEFEPPRDGAEG